MSEYSSARGLQCEKLYNLFPENAIMGHIVLIAVHVGAEKLESLLGYRRTGQKYSQEVEY